MEDRRSLRLLLPYIHFVGGKPEASMKELFVKVQYLVCWAGCNIPWQDRMFREWEKALEYYNQNLGKISLRIEQYWTSTKIKIVMPESKNPQKVN